MSADNNNTDKSTKKDQLMDHQFDGIQEYDNAIPLWMSVIFVGSIIFSILYMTYYHGLDMGSLPHEEYQAEMAAYASLKAELDAQKPAVDYAALAADQSAIDAGQQVYSSTCASCHGMQAEGLVGPSLKDNEWVNGDGSIQNIAEVASNGILDKGMPAWNHLGDTKIQQVSAFIYSLSHGNDVFGPSDAAAASSAPAQDDGNNAQQTFATVCAACHGTDGKGTNLPGVDLTDDEWITGSGTLSEVRDTIWNGAPAKGMPPWSSLGEEAVDQLSQYVVDLGQGS